MSEQQLNVLVTGASGKHTFKEIKDNDHGLKLFRGAVDRDSFQNQFDEQNLVQL